jgi:RNA polymerase sigma-70 factor (ECF subfamily)
MFDRCTTGESQAWRELYRTYYSKVCRFLTHVGVHAEELEDACQEVFVQVFRYLARFQHRADFLTWLYKLCLSQASRVRRRRRLQQALAVLLGREASVCPSSAGQVWSDAMVAERVQRALGRMRPIHREVFVLFELEGLEGDAVARVVSRPPPTVRRLLQQGRREFQQLLADSGRGERGKP